MSTTTDQCKQAFSMPPFSAEHMSTQKCAERLVALMSEGKNLDAIKELYADNARHVEVIDAPWCGRIIEGKATLLEKAEKFHASTTVHGATVGKPIVNGDQFVLPMSLDCTSNDGPMKGQRMNMTETALYTVTNGKITEGKFFYSMGM
ncbi:MAG: nuclear transport factor 2 family protein [Phycisphaerales bacterium]